MVVAMFFLKAEEACIAISDGFLLFGRPRWIDILESLYCRDLFREVLKIEG